MARKGAKKAAAAAAGDRNTETELETTTQPSLADELSFAQEDSAHDGYESSTHTDHDDFKDAADGSHADEMTPSSSTATTADASLQQ
ncbi:hypothetical protein, partial [Sporisorium scitamineum]